MKTKAEKAAYMKEYWRKRKEKENGVTVQTNNTSIQYGRWALSITSSGGVDKLIIEEK